MLRIHEAGFCASTSPCVLDRTGSSMAKKEGVCSKSNDRYFPSSSFSSSSASSFQTPSDRLHEKGALQGDEMRLSLAVERNSARRVAPRVPDGLMHGGGRAGLFFLVRLWVRSRFLPLRLIHTPRRQPDWKQTRRGATAHRSPALQQLAVQGAAQKLARSRNGPDRTGSSLIRSPLQI